jgi:hypothetical protein
MAEFVVASRVEDHDDDGVEDRGDERSKIMTMAGLNFLTTQGSKIVMMPGSNFLRRRSQIS